MPRVIVLTLFLVLVVTVSAEARPADWITKTYPGKAEAVQTAVQVGQAAFPKACKRPVVQFVKLGEDQFAQATRGYDFQGRRVCGILLNRQTWMKWSWPMLCSVVAHEVGHLAGKQHVYWGKDKNLMFFSFDPEDFTPYWRCGATPKEAKI
jgi:hypothetical protein